MRTYCAWPAKIIAIKGKRTEVFFFGTNQTGTVDTKDVALFVDKHEEVRRLLLLKRNDPTYIKSVKEIEGVLGIPEAHSIFNTLSLDL